MNLFQQYGIKEVADVVFYSINKIGDEEFYTPVLYLDTLKVSTIEKTAQKVSAQGGLGNKKLITWNYGKELTLNLEDALFSPASMSMIWGGTLNSVLSDITSTIVKCNVANKYGEKNYSTKAYPSPALNDREKDWLFSAATDSGYSILDNTEISTQLQQKIDDFSPSPDNTAIIIIGQSGQDYYNNNLKSSWSKQISTDTNSEQPINVFYFSSVHKSWTGVTDTEDEFSPGAKPMILTGTSEYNKLKKYVENSVKKYGICYFLLAFPERGFSYYDAENGLWNTVYALVGYCDSNAGGNGKLIYTGYNASHTLQTFYFLDLENNLHFHSLDYSATSIENALSQLKELQYVNYTSGILSSYLQTLLIKKYYSRLPQATIHENNHNEAIDQSIINKLITYLHTFNDIGKIETEMYDVEVLDRMEKCIVKSRHGFTISRKQQLNNLKRYYLDDQTSSYTIYYDPKTMLPLLPYISDQESFGNLQISSTTGNITDITDDEGNSIDKFKIKVGTVYYKWTRSVKYKSNDDTGILGRSFVIDAETFPDYYKIVGETYIRNRKTGKDQRYQFIINRASVAADTNITLEAEGDPTTFSMQIDVLTPPNDVMMELKQYDVEEDKINGGFSVVPQKSEYTYTPAWKEPENMQAPQNDEIY